jgi:opacity protein-like surface antigen
VAVPEEVELKSQYGLGPAASKVYGVERGLSIGGYGEAYYTNQLSGGSTDTADNLRFVQYIGYKFNENIVLNTEIEFEHATTSSIPDSGGGSVSVELMTLDFFWKEQANFRSGLVLIPMGFINEIHEPPTFFGVQRPETERRIIPSTWRELGAGLFGKITEDLEYRAYVVNGFDANGFSSSGIRGGRQKGNRVRAEDLAFVGRLDWTPLDALLLGGSVYVGNSGQDQDGVPNAQLTMFELHAQYRSGPWRARGLLAMNFLDEAGDLSTSLGFAPGKPVAERMLGGYGEVAYDVWPLLTGSETKYLAPFVRVEYVDPQNKVPSGFSRDATRRFWLATTGLSFKPHPNVVLKAEYRNFSAQDGEIPDEISVGMGFAF